MIGSDERGNMSAKINDLIFKELIKRKYSLDGNTRVWNLADSKLWYLTPLQAQGYLDLEKDREYKAAVVDGENKLIKNYIREIIGKLPNKFYNIVDLGCGDGKKAVTLIKNSNRHIKARYCPIDISSYMVNKAAKAIRKLNHGEVVEFQWNISDFENLINVTPLLRQGEFQNHFMTLLGNTLGNFDRDDILHGIKQSMKSGDWLLIGNGLNSSNKKDILKSYSNSLIDKWLSNVIKQIGLSTEDVEYGVRFNNSRVEEFYRLRKDKVVNHLGRKIVFMEGDIILVAISYKFSKQEFEKYLKKFFENVKIYTDNQETYALALCS